MCLNAFFLFNQPNKKSKTLRFRLSSGLTSCGTDFPVTALLLLAYFVSVGWMCHLLTRSGEPNWHTDSYNLVTWHVTGMGGDFAAQPTNLVCLGLVCIALAWLILFSINIDDIEHDILWLTGALQRSPMWCMMTRQKTVLSIWCSLEKRGLLLP